MAAVEIVGSSGSAGVVLLEALDGAGRPCGELSYLVTTEVIGTRHAYITAVLVASRARRSGVASSLIEALMNAEPALPVFVAPQSYNSAEGNALFDAWNSRHRRKVCFHEEP